MRDRLVPFVLMLAAFVLLGGCAGTARGVKQSVYENDEDLTVIDVSRSEADALVIIRYPAVVQDDALPAYYRLFEQHPIGGRVDVTELAHRTSERIAQSIIVKSNYYVMSLYRELNADLPEDSVLLSPHMVVLDDQGQLTSRPLLASEEIPAVLTIDFSVYSFPDAERMMDSPPLTFGDIITPLFVIHANRWLRPPTNGLLLSSEPLLPAAWSQSASQAQEQTASRLLEAPPDFSRPLDFISYLNQGQFPSDDLAVKSAGESRRDVVAVEAYPLEKIRMDADLMARLEYDLSVDPFAEDFVKGAATRTVTALNRVDHDRATFFTRQTALSRFDPVLGRAFLSRSQNEALRSRLQMAEALINAERRFLAAQSASLYEGAYEGAYGDQMRQMIAAEYRNLEQRRDMARTQNLSTALAIVAMAGAVYAGSNGDSSNFLYSDTMSNIMMLSSVWAANSAFALHAKSKIVGENFLVQMAPAINRQVSVQVEWLESTEEITARDFDEFREKTMALYQGSVRSLPGNFDPDCRFVHPAVSGYGRWTGRCEDGMAAFSGYGVVSDEQGNTIEYVGQAEEGLAQGIGAMIYRGPDETGAIYYEGGFAGGVPEGVVLVEEPGRKPRVRYFRAGVDDGAADADQLQRVRF
jgi:hypothetical protein